MGLMGEKLKLSRDYTLEELYEKIRDQRFAAGVPSRANHGPAQYIVFPELDMNNQVVIGKWRDTFYVQRSVQPIGLDKAVRNLVLDEVTDGWATMSAAFGGTKKRCKQLVVETANQINAMGL